MFHYRDQKQKARVHAAASRLGLGLRPWDLDDVESADPHRDPFKSTPVRRLFAMEPTKLYLVMTLVIAARTDDGGASVDQWLATHEPKE